MRGTESKKLNKTKTEREYQERLTTVRESEVESLRKWI